MWSIGPTSRERERVVYSRGNRAPAHILRLPFELESLADIVVNIIIITQGRSACESVQQQEEQGSRENRRLGRAQSSSDPSSDGEAGAPDKAGVGMSPLTR